MRRCIFLSGILLLFCLHVKAQFTLSESFKGSTVASSIVMGGNASLTSGGADPVNDGWLRLTPATGNQKGFAYVNSSFPSTMGVTLSFEYKTWRNSTDSYNGADGFCIFLFDASTTTFATGGYGGSLGYAPNTAQSPAVTTGLSGGYIGIGFDEYGNFSCANEGRIGGNSTTNPSPNSVTLRGPTTTSASTTNKYLTSTQLQTSSSADGVTSIDYNTVTATRPADATFYRKVQVTITPTGTGYYNIVVSWMTSPTGAYTQLLTYTTATAPPANLKVGFAASTGGGFNYHEIRNLYITTPGGVNMTKSVNQANVNVGGQLTYTVTVNNTTPAAISNLAFADTLKDGNGTPLVLGSTFTINSITFNNSGSSGNTAAGFTSGTAKTTGFTNPWSTTLAMVANGTVTFTIVGTVTNLPPGNVVKNSAGIDPTNTGITDQDLTNNYSTVSTTVLTPNVDFTISKGINSYCTDPTNGNTFTISVSNMGSQSSLNSTQVTVTDAVPSGLTVTSASGTGWTTTHSGNTYTFTRSDALASTYSYPTITITVTPPATGTSWTNTATVAYAGTETNTSNNSSSATIYVKPAAPTVTSPVTLCQGATASALTATGSGLLWYTSSSGTGSSTAPTPSTTSTGSTTYYVTQSNGGCISSQSSITVTVNPTASVTAMSSSICSGGSFTLTPTNSTNGTVPSGTYFTWAVPSGSGISGGSASSGSPTSVTGTLTNTTSSVATAVYNVIPVTGSCSGSTFTVTITVNPVATINSSNLSYCGTAAFTATPVDGTNGIVPSGTTYTWATPSLSSTGVTGGAAGSGSAISGTLVNTTSTSQTATYTVNPTSSGCAGSSFTVIVTIAPCSDLSVTKSVNNSAPYEGATVTFTIVATNSGPSAATGVKVNDVLPSGFAYSSSSVTAGSYSNSTGIWTIGSLASGSSATLTLLATVQ